MGEKLASDILGTYYIVSSISVHYTTDDRMPEFVKNRNRNKPKKFPEGIFFLFFAVLQFWHFQCQTNKKKAKVCGDSKQVKVSPVGNERLSVTL